MNIDISKLNFQINQDVDNHSRCVTITVEVERPIDLNENDIVNFSYDGMFIFTGHVKVIRECTKNITSIYARGRLNGKVST